MTRSSLVRATGLIGAATLASRLLGLARDLLLAAVLGAGPAADAFFVAWRLPNLLRRVLGEGGLNAALVPVERRVRAESGALAARGFAGQALAGAALVLTVIVLAVEIFAPSLVLAMAPGFAEAPGTLATAILCLRLAAPSLAFAVLASLAAALVNARGAFAAPALAALAVNAVMIAAIVMVSRSPAADDTRAAWLAVAVSLASLAQLALTIPALLAGPEAPGLVRPALTPPIRSLLVGSLPGLAVAGATQLSMLVALMVASSDPGAVAHLNYADRILQLPLGFVAVGAGIVLLPELARLVQSGAAAAEHHAAQNRSLELALAMAMPAAVALAVLAAPIVELLFQRGAFGPQDATATATALAALAPGLPAAGLMRILAQPFFARERSRPPLLATLAAVTTTAAAAFVLQRPAGTAGIAAGVSAGAWVGAALVGALAWRAGWWSLDGAVARRIASVLAASVLMGAALWAGLREAAPWLEPGQSLALRTVALAALCGGGLAFYAALALALGGLRATDLRSWR
jgi:putative peptidoglycan lipid II flippase